MVRYCAVNCRMSSLMIVHSGFKLLNASGAAVGKVVNATEHADGDVYLTHGLR